MKKLKEILYVFLICIPLAVTIFVLAHIGILIYKLYKMTKVNDIKVIDPEVVSDDFSAVIRRLDIEEAKKTLMEAGYFVDNLWCVQDVQENYNCTEEEAQEVLSKSLTNDGTYEQIWTSIGYYAESINLKRKKK